MILWSVNQHKTQFKNFQNFQRLKRLLNPKFFSLKNIEEKKSDLLKLPVFFGGWWCSSIGTLGWVIEHFLSDGWTVFFWFGKKTCTNSIRCTKNILDIVSDVIFFYFLRIYDQFWRKRCLQLVPTIAVFSDFARWFVGGRRVYPCPTNCPHLQQSSFKNLPSLMLRLLRVQNLHRSCTSTTTLPETDSECKLLKINLLKMNFLLEWPIFRYKPLVLWNV